VHRRFLAVLAVAAFVLTLLFAVAAGAQEESTSTEGVGAQAVEVQQQQVQNDQQQQQVLTSQQGLIFAEGQQASGVQAAATGSGALRGTKVETRSTDDDPRIEVMRIPFPNDCKMTKNKVSFVLEDEDGTQADFIEDNNVKVVREGDELKLTRDPDFVSSGDQNAIVPLNPRGGDRQLDTGGLTVATSTGITCDNDSGSGGGSNDLDCADFSSQSAAQNKLEEDRSDPHNLDADNDGRACEDFNYGGGGGGGGGDGNNPVSVAQENSVPETTTSNLNTANPNTTAADANALNANTNRPNSGNFRCEFFLRTVTDDTGALRAQYRGDEQIVQRFEQCLSEDVLADTIPNRALPFTGGMSLLILGAIGLAAIVAGAAVLRAVTRRGR
jgi:hypothetical protein